MKRYYFIIDQDPSTQFWVSASNKGMAKVEARHHLKTSGIWYAGITFELIK